MKTASCRRVICAIGACLLTAGAARAQQPSPAQGASVPAAPTIPSFGTIDFGFRGRSGTGDDARFERFRDLREGVYSRIVFGEATERHLYNVQAFNVGYRDQRVSGAYTGNNLRLTGFWDS